MRNLQVNPFTNEIIESALLYYTENLIIPSSPNYPEGSPQMYTVFLKEAPYLDNRASYPIEVRHGSANYPFTETTQEPGDNQFRIAPFGSMRPNIIQFSSLNSGFPVKITYYGYGGIVDIKEKVPVGFVYIQFPWKAEPSAIFGGVWQKIFTGGLFFRTEGGSAKPFGDPPQDYATLNIQGEIYGISETFFASGYTTGVFQKINYPEPFSNTPSTTDYSPAGKILFNLSDYLGTSKIATEVRPLNITIRIWEKIAN